MRALDLYENTEIDEWLDQVAKNSWERNPDGTINVQGNVKIPTKTKILPVQFRYVSGDFDCSFTDLISTDGFPREIGGNFTCSSTFITSLKGGPEKVDGSFYCNNTDITSLVGSPQEIGGSFFCYSTIITSLEGVPEKIGGNFDCSVTNITSLKGAPKKIGYKFYCFNTRISDPYEYRYALLSVIDRTFNSKIRKVDEIINAYGWDGSNNPESKRKVPIGLQKLKELSNEST